MLFENVLFTFKVALHSNFVTSEKGVDDCDHELQLTTLYSSYKFVINHTLRFLHYKHKKVCVTSLQEPVWH